MEQERVPMKKGRRMFWYVFSSIVLLIIIIQLDTNMVMRDVRNAFLSEDYYVSEERYNRYPQAYTNPNVNYVVFKEYTYESLGTNYLNRHFNRSRCVSPSQAGLEIVVDLKLNRLFAMHSFVDGYVWFTYFVYYRDADGNLLCGGGANEILSPVKMQIHRENGQWQVVSIWENP